MLVSDKEDIELTSDGNNSDDKVKMNLSILSNLWESDKATFSLRIQLMLWIRIIIMHIIEL